MFQDGSLEYFIGGAVGALIKELFRWKKTIREENELTSKHITGLLTISILIVITGGLLAIYAVPVFNFLENFRNIGAIIIGASQDQIITYLSKLPFFDPEVPMGQHTPLKPKGILINFLRR